MNDLVSQMQADVVAKLGAETFFAQFTIIPEIEGVTELDFEKALSTVKVTGGKIGAVLLVRLPTVNNQDFGSVVIQNRIRLSVRVLELPKFNRGPRGTGVTYSAISRELQIALNAFCLGASTLYFKGTQPYNDGEGTIGEDVYFETIQALPMASKCQKPRISGDASAVTITTGTPGAALRYTTDGSFPTPNATLYAGPFAVALPACVRAVAWLAGLQGSDVATMSF